MPKTPKKHVKITVIQSDQVVQHIVPHEKDKKKISAANVDLTYSSNHADKKKSTHVSSEDEMECHTPAKSFENDAPEFVDVYKFRTPKKSGQMALKADSCTPKQKHDNQPKSAQNTPDGKHLKHLKTPPRSQSLLKKNLDAVATSPRVSEGQSHKRMESSTPYRLRKRNLDPQQTVSSSDDSIDESSSEDSDVEDEPNTDSANATSKTNMAATAEAYFDLHSAAPVTSDRTLSALDGPRLDLDTIRKVLKQFNNGHQSQLQALMEKHTRLFKRWMFHMCCGYNILLYGLGSKRILLDKFKDEHLKDFSHLVVNGYFPSLTAKNILNSITEDILDNPKGFSNVYTQIEFVKDTFRQRNEDFYLLIHNIDGVLLRSEKCQAILSSLTEIESIHIIGSVDHINAAFMWDQNKYSRFHWLWYETATFLHYEAENSYENSLMVQQSGSLALSSLVHVMRSLTPNARQVFILLAEYQLEKGNIQNYVGMSFQNLYLKCREAFLVNSDLTLQAQLVEFKDHRLIRSKKNFEGIEHLIIPIDNGTLKEFLQEHKAASG
ncbi:Origin recognition complex subunit 2 [Bulinus truncatus]|nr:Origin recognition complex subunit 2 [Bulinus truncatus]